MTPTPDRPEKTCVACGRRIAWRKKWERDWDNVKYCSDACRRSRPGETDRALEEAIVALLRSRRAGSSICPSEAARAVVGEDGWRESMEATRRAARRLVARGVVRITQKGREVDPSMARGPIRIALA